MGRRDVVWSMPDWSSQGRSVSGVSADGRWLATPTWDSPVSLTTGVFLTPVPKPALTTEPASSFKTGGILSLC